MAELINRRARKAETKRLLADAQVSPKAMTALYLGLLLALNLVSMIPQEEGLLTTFIAVLTTLVRLILSAGFVLYCMAVRRGERRIRDRQLGKGISLGGIRVRQGIPPDIQPTFRR